jgi:hypothetical protein
MRLATKLLIIGALAATGVPALRAEDDAGTAAGSAGTAKPGAAVFKNVGAKKAEAKPQAGKGEDANVKDKSEVNAIHGTQQKAPTGKKAGPDGKATFTDAQGTRWCVVTADNYSPYIIQIFVDGTYRGAVGSFGKGDTITLSGPTQLYARALFDDGSYKYWGPSTVNCFDNFYWKLDSD